MPPVKVYEGDTANAIPGAKLKIHPGMGHDLLAPLLDGILHMIVEQVF